MTPMLGKLALDRFHARVTETLRIEEGRMRRVVSIRGAADHFEDNEALEQALDAIPGATRGADFALLRLRPERSMSVRFRRFERERLDTTPMGSFVLELESLDPWELADIEQSLLFNVDGAGVAGVIHAAGTLAAPLRLTFTATTNAFYPAFSDGEGELRYDGLVAAGQTLHIDGALRNARLDDEDASSQLSGVFPLAAPQSTDISMTTAVGAPPAGVLTVAWRDRWM